MKTLRLVNTHFENNFWLYMVSIFCVFLGILLGIYTVKYMGTVEKEQLISYLSKFIESINNKNIIYKDIFYESIKNNIPIIIGIWFLGLTVIGIPLILIIDIIKGYTLGFTISFIIKGIGVKGIWITLLGILPQNIIYLPCVIFASVIAMEFSLIFLKSNMYKQWTSSIIRRITSYSLLFSAIFILMCLGFLLEAYGTPFFIKILLH